MASSTSLRLVTLVMSNVIVRKGRLYRPDDLHQHQVARTRPGGPAPFPLISINATPREQLHGALGVSPALRVSPCRTAYRS